MAQNSGDRRHKVPERLPPTPPESEQSDEEKPEHDISPLLQNERYPLPPPTSEPVAVLEADKKTPDAWLPRDPRLIRLTGVHP